MKINVEVEFPEWDGPDGFESVETEVVKQVARLILDTCERKIVEDTRAEVKAQIRESVHEIVQDALVTPLRKTNQWGEITGEALPLRAHIVALAENYMAAEVCEKTGKSEGYYKDKKVPRAEYFLRKVVREGLEGFYLKQIDEAINQVKGELDDKLAEMVRDAIREVVS